MQVYLDLVVILNFLVDLLLILGTNRLSGFSLGIKRALAAAAIGGVYGGACVWPGMEFLSGTLWRLVSLAMMSVTAFGLGNGAVRRGILLTLLSMALGGIALGLGNGGFWAIIMGALGVTIACVVGFCGRPGQQRYVPVSIAYGGRQVHLTALIDTGNTLRDPISGAGVLVLDGAMAQKLVGLSAFDLAHPVETVERASDRRLRLIPYHAVGQPGSMLVALRADAVRIDGREQEVLVAFAPQRIGQGKPYQALAGGNMQ